jgi:hypothetical protein
VRERKRKLIYVSNILVVRDPKNSDNNGKVKLFKYGAKIYEKINNLMNPDPDSDDQKVIPFDFWEGANFRLKMASDSHGYPNYNNSLFDSPTALFNGDDKEIEKIWKQEYSLQEFVDEKQFLSYDELKKKLQKVLGGTAPKTSNIQDVDDDDEPKQAAPAPARTRQAQKPAAVDTDVDDATLAMFNQIVDEIAG